jgi:uncharacterized protein DUF4430
MRSVVAPRRLVVAAALALTLSVTVLSGCGLGPGSVPHDIRLLVTRDFGARVLHEARAPKASGQETVMSLLMRNYKVGTRYGGGFVESIDGVSGNEEGGKPIDWFYYVNGVEATRGAASTNVNPGDRIWWDRHDWSQTEDVPAVVGAFPEPFLNGLGGRRLPVRIECTQVSSYACHAVTARLRALGVPAAIGAFDAGRQPETLRVLVGPWANMASDPVVQGVSRGPRASGIYARFSTDGRTLTPLDQDGHPGRALSSGAGLVAATRQAEDAPIWLVTGTDEAGVNLAARSLNETMLRNRFAVALTSAGVLALPSAGG